MDLHTEPAPLSGHGRFSQADCWSRFSFPQKESSGDEKMLGIKRPLLCTGILERTEDCENNFGNLQNQTTNEFSSCGNGRFEGENRCAEDWRMEGSSFLQAILNGMNVLAGVGVLSTPYAVFEGGWLGLSFLFLFAVICCYTGILLRRCLDTDSQLLSYPDIGQAAFGQHGRMIVSLLLYFELYAVAVEFLILEGDNMAQLFPFGDINVWGINIKAENGFVLISALVMLPTVWLRDLSLLAYVSAGGVVAAVLVVFAVGWIGIFDGVGFHQRGELLKLRRLPIALGLYTFCYCGHAVFPTIYGSMRDRSKFSHVLVICFVLCTIIYAGIAVIGFLMFGDGIQSQVTLNLPRNAVATKIAIFTTLVNPLAKYALTLMPLAASLEGFFHLSSTARAHVLWSSALRTLLVSSTVLVALTVPFFAYVMAFIGSFLSITVSILVPCICYLKIFRSVSSSEVTLIIFLLFIGVVSCIVGTYSSVQEIISKF